MQAIEHIPTGQLAKFLGVTSPYVSHLKAGRRKIPADKARKVSVEFNIPLWELRPDIYPKDIMCGQIKQDQGVGCEQS
jgi:DNA-binding transcriptional regulator YdaS (Cro superfamily)